MITFLYDKDDNLISDLINSAILEPDVIKIKNRLLDGTYHIQNIGNRMDIINVTCYVDKLNKVKLDNIYSMNEPIKLVKEKKYYIGMIDETSGWEKFSKELYIISFLLMVNSEGVI